MTHYLNDSLFDCLNIWHGQPQSSTWPMSSTWPNQNNRNLKREFNMAIGFNLPKWKFLYLKEWVQYDLWVQHEQRRILEIQREGVQHGHQVQLDHIRKYSTWTTRKFNMTSEFNMTKPDWLTIQLTHYLSDILSNWLAIWRTHNITDSLTILTHTRLIKKVLESVLYSLRNRSHKL